MPAGLAAVTASGRLFEPAKISVEVMAGVTATAELLLTPITWGTISGLVVDTATGAPLAGVQVSVAGRRALSDGAGRFRFEQVAAGRVVAAAEHPGYQPAAAELELEATAVAETTLALSRITWGTVEGSVVDAVTGEPLTGARVNAAGRRQIADEQGRFRFERVPAGELRVVAGKAVYRPGEVAVDLAATATVEAHLRLQPITRGEISGQVVDALSGEPVADARVSAGGVAMTTDSLGRFVLEEVSAGRVAVTVTNPGYRPGAVVVELPAAERVETTVVVEPILTGTVTGSVIDRTTRQPVAGVRVGAAGSFAETDGSGRFVFEQVDAGTVAVTARHPEYRNASERAELTAAATVEVTLELDLRREDVTELEAGLGSHGTVDLYGIHFDSGEDRFKPSSQSTLRAVLRVIERAPDRRFRVAGHTDSDGDESYNQALSERRARTVIGWLVDHGIDRRRLLAKGFGESRQAAPNETAAGKALNRRVQLSMVDR